MKKQIIQLTASFLFITIAGSNAFAQAQQLSQKYFDQHFKWAYDTKKITPKTTALYLEMRQGFAQPIVRHQQLKVIQVVKVFCGPPRISSRSLFHNIKGLKNLEAIIVRNGRIDNIPPQIKQLKKLRFLDLTENYLKTLPKEITHLTNLHTLDLSGNILLKLPSEIKQMKSLRWLILDKVKLSGREKAELKKALPNCNIIFENKTK